MFLSILKSVLFASAVLMIGQIPIGKSTVGAQFYDQVVLACHWGTRQVKETKILAGFGEASLIDRWWNNARAPKPQPRSREIKKEETEENTPAKESLSPSDREALIRLLQ